MGLGNLNVKISADIGSFTTNMDIVRNVAQQRMSETTASVEAYRREILAAGEQTKTSAEEIGAAVAASNAVIVQTSAQAANELANIESVANKADLSSFGEKISYAIASGVGAGFFAAEKAWDGFVAFSKTKAIIVGAVVTAIFAAAGLGAVYTAYKVISGSMDFIAGLISGESYKSANIDALKLANDQVVELQKSLNLTAVQAAATNEAIAALGVNKADYTSVYKAAEEAMRSNVAVLDELGVKHSTVEETIRSANQVLSEYTEGYDRNTMAQQMGLGSAEQVAEAAKASGEKIAEAHERLKAYNLGIGTESQEAIKRYDDAMRDFNHNTELTSQGFKRAIADQIMPVLTDFAEFMKDGWPTVVQGFRGAMAGFTSVFYGLKMAVGASLEAVIGQVQAFQAIISGVGGSIASVFRGDFTTAKDELIAGWENAKQRISQIGDNIVAQAEKNGKAIKLAFAMDDRDSPEAAKKGKEATDVAASLKTAKEQLDTYKKMRGAIMEKIEAQQLELKLGEKLTDGQRELLKFNKAVEEGTLKLSDTQKRSYTEMLGKQIELEDQIAKADEARKNAHKREESDYEKIKKLIAEKTAIQAQEIAGGKELSEIERTRIKMLADMTSGHFKYAKASRESQAEQRKELDLALQKLEADRRASEEAKKRNEDRAKYLNLLITDLDGIKAQIKQQEDYNERIGKTKVQIAEINALEAERQALLLENNAVLQLAADADEIAYDMAIKQAKAKRDLAAAIREGGSRESAAEASAELAKQLAEDAKKIDDAYTKTYRKIEDGLAEAGAKGSKQLFKRLEQDAKAWLIRVAFQPVIAPIAAFGAALINPAAAQAQSLTGGVGSAGSLLGAISNIPTALSTLGGNIATSVGTAFETFGSKLGWEALTNFGQGMQWSSLAGTSAVEGATAAGASFSSTLGTVMPYAAAAVAAYYVATKGFGHGDRKTESEDITANLSNGGVTGSKNVHHVKEGGWFSSDIRGVWNFDLNSGKTVADGVSYNDTTGSATAAGKAIKAGYDSLLASSTAYASALGLSAESIKQKAYSLSFDVGKSQDEFNQNLTKALTSVADTMATDLYPSIANLSKEGETASQTLARVATDIASVNDIFGKLNLSLFALNEAGLGAMEKLVAASGSLQNLQQQASAYYDKYYTEEEKRANVVKSITAEFAKANLGALPDTREGFRALVEQMNRTGTPEQVASLLKVADAFAQVVDASSATRAAITGQQMVTFSHSVDEFAFAATKLSSTRTAEIAGRRALFRQEAELSQQAHQQYVERVQSLNTTVRDLMRSGDLRGVNHARYNVEPPDPSQYLSNTGEFIAGSFNAAMGRLQQRWALENARLASDMALTTPNALSIVKSVNPDAAGSANYRQQQVNMAINNGLDPAGTIAASLSGLFDAVMTRSNLRDLHMSSGIGGVMSAKWALDYAQYRDTGMQRDVAAYTSSIGLLREQVKSGRITTDDYRNAIQLANQLLDDGIALYRNEAAQLDNVQRARQAYADAGRDSIVYYFDQIGKAVSDAADAAKVANAPIAQVTQAISRMQSIAQVFALSADAAATDASNQSIVDKAGLVSKQAEKLQQLMTTADAAQAAKSIKSSAEFTQMSSGQLKATSLLLDGIKKFDGNSLEKAYLRITDAYAKGTVTAAQYEKLLDISSNTYTGLDAELEKASESFRRFRESMQSFADNLLVDRNLTTLTDAQSNDVLFGQYGALLAKAQGGDASALQSYQDLANKMLNKDRYATQAEYNAIFGKVYGDSRRLEAIAAQLADQPVVDQLKENSREMTDRIAKLETELLTVLDRIAKSSDSTSRGIEARNLFA